MIHFDSSPEPPDFDQKVRQPGLAWLKRSENAPKDLWTPFKTALAHGFRNLCGYSAMYEPVGTVDHYLSQTHYRHLAYEWNNYRYASAWINSSKGTLNDQILDPFEVQDGWFEIQLPSLQLVMTDAIPVSKREQARFTLERLHLRDDERVIRQRQSWYAMYQSGKLSLGGLEEVSPLIAQAIIRQRSIINFALTANWAKQAPDSE